MAPPRAALAKDRVAELLSAHAEELRSLGVRSLDLFGSTARGDARPDSDVDLLVEFNEVPGLFGYVRIQHRLECSVRRDVSRDWRPVRQGAHDPQARRPRKRAGGFRRSRQRTD